MKTAMLFTVSAFVLASAFYGQAAESANTFGVQRVDSKEVQTVVFVPWVEASNAGTGIKVKDVVKTANLTIGDRLLWYDRVNSYYLAWVLMDSGSGAHWEAYSTSVLIGGKQENIEAGDDTKELSRGDALILIRNYPTDGSGNAKPFYIQGQVAATAADGIEFPDPILGNDTIYTLFAPPIPSINGLDVNDFAWSDNIKPTTESAEGDWLMIKTARGLETLMWNSTDKKWGEFTLDLSVDWPAHKKGSWKEVSVERRTILPGSGAWFMSRGPASSGKRSVSWTKSSAQ